MASPRDILKQYWGYESFRPLQEDIIQSILDKKDVLALLPTGGGKSICFQVPALLLDGLCMVISPLIALMKDQVQNLQQKNIPALALHSGMQPPEVERTLQQAISGQYKFLYVSPERLETRLFQEYLPALPIRLLAIDEAHCISQWGYDFRPPYLRIAAFREKIPGVPCLALTASATRKVQDDIRLRLNFGKAQAVFQQSFARPNLSYTVREPVSKQTQLLEILRRVAGSSIVYCKTRKHTKQVADLLKMHGLAADFYHAGLSHAERNTRQQDWISGKIRVIAATNAFGMGIDKPDVRSVVHYDLPDCLENYYQEAGRAGRDGQPAYAVLLIQAKEPEELKQQVSIRFPEPDTLKELYIAILNYLQVAAGTGEGQAFPFDIVDFAEKFKIPVTTATYGLQALAQDGIFTYSDAFFRPSRLVFTASKADLFQLENSHPALDAVVKGLLRSYEGIFDFPAGIHEKSLARFVGMPVDELIQRLHQLHRMQLVDYLPASEGPELYLLKNRMYQDAFFFHYAAYQERKQTYLNRVQAMIDYCNNQQDCRSKIIGQYFNDATVPDCGICDNCIRKKKSIAGKEIFQRLHDWIREQLQTQPMAIQLLEERAIQEGLHAHFWTLYEYLETEGKLEMDAQELIRWKG